VSFSPLSVVILKGSPVESTSLPHPALAAHVSSFWDLRLEGGLHQVRSLPDGCTDLTFDLRAVPAAAHVSGPQQAPRTFELRDRVWLFGVRLLPGAAPSLLGGPVTSADLWVPLARWLGDGASALAQAVASAPDAAARIAVVEAWLTQRLLGGHDRRLGKAMALIFDNAGSVRIAELAIAAGTTERALSRLFTDRVGLSPKRFACVVRFQHVLRRLEGRPDWAQLALELGYFDQAHMIREFKRLFGCTPGDAVALVAG
jgi:AraC-like DNA-binding protein